MGSEQPEKAPSLPKRLRMHKISPAVWFGGFGIFCSIAVGIWGAYRFNLELTMLPPTAVAFFFLFLGMSVVCLFAAGRELYIREGITIAEKSGLLPANRLTDEKPNPYRQAIESAKHAINDEDISMLLLFVRGNKTAYAAHELTDASGLARERCQYHLDRLIAATYVTSYSDVDLRSASMVTRYRLSPEGRAVLVNLKLL